MEAPSFLADDETEPAEGTSTKPSVLSDEPEPTGMQPGMRGLSDFMKSRVKKWAANNDPIAHMRTAPSEVQTETLRVVLVGDGAIGKVIGWRWLGTPF